MKNASLIKRRAQQARLREKRNFHIWAATATADLVQKPIRPLTGVAYNRMLQAWDLFAAESGPNTSPLDVATLKRFLKWYCDGSKGRLTARTSAGDTDRRITQDSAYSCWKSFMSAWHRRSGDTFSKGIQNTIETLIYGGDDNWLNLCTARRPARNFTLTDFEACVRQLWQNDWYDFRCEAYRIGLHQMMLMHIGTSARSAEYVMNLRYRDTLLYQVWFEDRPQPQLVIDLCRNHTKGLANLPRQQPEHLLYELVDLPFYYNTIAFFVAGLLAVQGLRHFDSWSKVCAVKKPPDRNFLCLDYTNDVLDRHVYSRYSATAGSQTKAATSLVEALARLGQRTGFCDRPTPGAIRREALLQVDRHGYSINERMRHADHRNPNTYGGYYQNAISTVDGQATYFGLEQQLPVLHELFRGFSIRRDYQYRPEVPWRLLNQISDVQPSIESDNDVVDRRVRQKLYDDRRRQRDAVRRTDQQGTVMEANTLAACAYESDFQQARRLMPERNRLADSLFQTGSLRNAQGIDLMNDLVTLFSSRTSETYCVELNSSRSHCVTCGITCQGDTSQEWWRHVYHCRKDRFERVGGFADFCFLCFAWIDNVDAWDEHAKQHNHDVPLKCNMAMFRGTVLRPAWCPDCMSQTGIPGPGGNGLTQFLNVTAWKAHMDKHVHGLQPGQHKCSHPRCLHLPSCASIADYIAHRFDVHLIPAPDGVEGDMTWRVKTSKKNRSANKAVSSTPRFEHSGRTPSGQRHEAFSSDSTRAGTPSYPEASSPSQGVESSIVADEENVRTGNGEDEASPASDMPFNTDYSQAQQHWADQSPATLNKLSSSGSLSSSAWCGLLRSPDSPLHRRQQSRSVFGSMTPNGVDPGSTTIEVLIPLKPSGWENVPLANCDCCSDESVCEDTVCDEVTLNDSLDEAEKGNAALLSGPVPCPAERLMRPTEPRSVAARGIRSRIIESATISREFTRRRQAITEMHARIRDRRKSRFKVTATVSA